MEFTTFAVILLLGVLFLIDKKPFSKHKLKEQVKWCVKDFSLYDLYDCSAKLNIEKQYRLTLNDETMVKDILKKFLDNLKENYTCDNLKVNPHIASFSYKEYFCFSLTAFLRSHYIKRTFYNNELYSTFVLQEGSFEHPFSRTYELTEYGITLNKLYLLSELVCEQSKNVNKNGNFYSSDNIKKNIKSKQITIYYG